MKRKPLIAAAIVCAVMAPALAYSQTSSSGTFTATDPYAWSANGASATTLTITAGGTVTFEYPPGGGSNGHNVAWEGTPPPCTGNIPGDGVYGRRPWKGTCTFAAPGTYRFECKVHSPLMKGSVVVVAPDPTASPTPTATGTATPDGPGTGTGTTPATTAQPTATPTGPLTEPLAAKLAGTQKGTQIRGSVTVKQPASRVEITVTLGKARVGHWLKAAAASGARTFAVPLNARGRRELKRRHSLKLTVSVAVTPRGAAQQVRTFAVRLRG